MRKAFDPVDLVGRKFGKLTVKAYAGQRKTGKRKIHVYQCLCDCGNEITADRNQLLSARKSSCGHCRRDSQEVKLVQTAKDQFEPGLMAFYELTRPTVFNRDDEHKKEPDPEDLIGRRFGRLKVLSYAGKRKGGYWSPDEYLCQCSCGNKILVSRQSLLSGAATSCGCQSKTRLP